MAVFTQESIDELKRHAEAREKAQRIFNASPWLKTSKNIVHMPVLDPDRPEDKPAQTLPGLTWAELFALAGCY